jgi:hypothetical protein
MAELSKILSERWKQLTPAEKAPFVLRSEEAKREFVDKYDDNTKKGLRMAAASALHEGWKLVKDASSGAAVFFNTVTKRCRWVLPATDACLGDLGRLGGLEGTRVVDEALEPVTAVRKPSASAFFVTHTKLLTGETSHALHSRWKDLTTDEKAPFVEMHNADILRFKSEKGGDGRGALALRVCQEEG